jgi:dolichyl-diphosphooligosaccharide--protein glycosyltransferase
MRARRLLFLAGIAAAMLLAAVFRLSTRPQLSAGARVRGLTVDDYYHLRRARFAVAHFPETIVFDPLMNFPAGGVPIWPPLFDIALAAPSRLLHGPDAPADAIEREAAGVPLALGVAAVGLAGALGMRIAGPAAGISLAVFVAICPGHIRWTQYGHTDQHVLESAMGLLVLVLFLRTRERPRASTELATGIALAAAVVAWQGAIYWGAIIALALFLEALLARTPVLRAAVLVLGVGAAVSLAATAAWLGPHRPPFTYISFGFFQPLFLAALAAGTVLLETAVQAGRRLLTRRDVVVRTAALAAAAAIVLPFSRDLLLGLWRGAGYVVGSTSEVAGQGGYVQYPRNWLSGIFEARPILADGPRFALGQLSAGFFLAPAAVLLWAARAARRERTGVHATLAVWGAVTLLLVLAQRLNTYYAAPLVGATLIELWLLLARRLAAPPGRARAGATLAGLLLLLPMFPGLRDELRSILVPGSDLFATLDWMRERLPRAVEAYDARLLAAPPAAPGLDRAAAVLAPWSLGHLILYETEQPVVANNFGYGFLDSIRFFLAETEEEALAIARARRVRWVLASDLVPRMNDYAGYLGRPPYLQMSPSAGLVPSASYFATVQSRLYDFDGGGGQLANLTVEPLPHFRLLHHSQSAIRRGNRWVARWKVFEIVE